MSLQVPILKQSGIFQQFTPKQLEMVANLCHEEIFQTGDFVIKENSDRKALYIVADGEVEILIDSTSHKASGTHPKNNSAITTVRRGEYFGELNLVDKDFKYGFVQVTQDGTRVLGIDRDRLLMLCETYPPLGFRLMYNLATELGLKILNTNLQRQENQANALVEDKK
jgi:CRP/FNR family transcriptional regulator, cyclic AMP receptor protein